MNNKKQYMLTVELIDKYEDIALERFTKIALIFLNSDLYKNKDDICIPDYEILNTQFPLLTNFPSIDRNEIFDYDSLDALNKALKIKLGRISTDTIGKDAIIFEIQENNEPDYTDYIYMPAFIAYQTDEEFYNYTIELKKQINALYQYILKNKDTK